MCLPDYIAVLDQKYNETLVHAYAESTASANRQRWQKFVEFHLAHRLVIFPPNYVNVARFLTHYASTVNAFATVQNMLSSIKTFCALYQFKLNVANPIIDLYIKAARRTMSSTSHPKSPIQPAHLVLIPSALDPHSPMHFMQLF